MGRERGRVRMGRVPCSSSLCAAPAARLQPLYGNPCRNPHPCVPMGAPSISRLPLGIPITLGHSGCY